MAMGDKVNVLERCQVAPPLGTVAEKSLPLTFFDLHWLHLPLVHHVFFYDFPHSKNHFIEIVIPNLKRSTSFALKHFFPYAGNLVIPSESGKPEIRYMDGDSVLMIIAESSNDFNHLTGNSPRKADEFYPLVPRMPKATYLPTTTIAPLLALQVTLFPNFGICIGLTLHHAASDATTSMNFLKSWALITKSAGDEACLANEMLPFYDRTVIKETLELESRQWSRFRETKYEQCQVHDFATNKLRATVILRQFDAQRLKKKVLAERPNVPYVSTYTIICAYVWTCLLKLRLVNGEEMAEDEMDYLVCSFDCRTRLRPPIPATYFGNCLAPIFVGFKSADLMGKEGFLIAAELIGEAIHNMLNNKEGVLAAVRTEAWDLDLKALTRGRLASTAGSPKMDFYGVDFGWGRPRKNEIVSTDMTEAFSVLECRDSKADIEIGLSFPAEKLEAFAPIFADGLQDLVSSCTCSDNLTYFTS